MTCSGAVAPEAIEAAFDFEDIRKRTWTADVPTWLVRFIGFCEVAGAIGVILPAATGILPFLTPLAALGFVAIQVLAIPFHAMRGETAQTLPINLVYLALAVFVLWGRTRKLPIQPRP